MQITMNRALSWKHTFIRNEPQSNYWQLMLSSCLWYFFRADHRDATSWFWYFFRADHRDATSWFWNSFVAVSAGSFDKGQLQTQSSSYWAYLTYWSQMCSIIIFVGRWLVSLTIRVDSFLSVWFFWGGGWCFITTLSVMVTSAVFESW